MPTILWPNQTKQSAENWKDLERILHQSQFDHDATKEEFRDSLARRVQFFRGIEIDTSGNSLDLFFELERAGILLVVET